VGKSAIPLSPVILHENVTHSPHSPRRVLAMYFDVRRRRVGNTISRGGVVLHRVPRSGRRPPPLPRPGSRVAPISIRARGRVPPSCPRHQRHPERSSRSDKRPERTEGQSRIHTMDFPPRRARQGPPRTGLEAARAHSPLLPRSSSRSASAVKWASMSSLLSWVNLRLSLRTTLASRSDALRSEPSTFCKQASASCTVSS
jgi:hypothetical protein